MINFCISMITSWTKNKYCPNCISIFKPWCHITIYTNWSCEDFEITHFNNFQILQLPDRKKHIFKRLITFKIAPYSTSIITNLTTHWAVIVMVSHKYSTASLYYKDRIWSLTFASEKSAAWQAHDPRYLPVPQHKVCARLRTSCQEEVYLIWRNRNSKWGKEQVRFSDGFQCSYPHAAQGATKFSASDVMWYPLRHYLDVEAARAFGQNVALHQVAPVT